MSSNENKPFSLPKLRFYFVIITALLVASILASQIFQDTYRKEELLESRRIQTLHKQVELISNMETQLLLMKVADNEVKLEHEVRQVIYDKNLLLESQLLLSQLNQSLIVMGEKDNFATQEAVLAGYVEQLVSLTSEIESAIEHGTISDADLNEFYLQFTLIYKDYWPTAIRAVSYLTNFAEKELQHHKIVLWWVVIGLILLVLLASKIIYKLMAELIYREFELIDINQQQLEKENIERAQSHAVMAKQADELRENQMKTKAILESTVDAIITINNKGKIESFNAAAEQMFGYFSSSVIGENINMLMPEPYHSEHDGYIEHFLQTGEHKIIGATRVVSAQRSDGTTFPIELSVAEVASVTPKIFTGIIKDITERRKREEKLRVTLDDLQRTQALLEEEERIACHVFENITSRNNASLPQVTAWCQPMRTFSGDMMLSTLLPSGVIRVLLCDFTGHGLPAALGAIPVSTISAATSEKDLPLEILMQELNSKLCSLLPRGIFCCISAIDIDLTRNYAQIWNSGLPEVLLVNDKGTIKQRFKSTHLPLGVMAYEQSEMQSERIKFEKGDSFYLYSDGLTEAENKDGDMFGLKRFEQLLSTEIALSGRVDFIQQSVEQFTDGAAATDDISIIEIKTVVTEQ